MEKENRLLQSMLDSYIVRRDVVQLIANILKWTILANAMAIIFKVIGPEIGRIENFLALKKLLTTNFTAFVIEGFIYTFSAYLGLELFLIKLNLNIRKITNAINNLSYKYSKSESKSKKLKRVLLKRHERKYLPPD